MLAVVTRTSDHVKPALVAWRTVIELAEGTPAVSSLKRWMPANREHLRYQATTLAITNWPVAARSSDQQVLGRGYQSGTLGERGGLGSVGDAKLAQDIAHVDACGLSTDE